MISEKIQEAKWNIIIHQKPIFFVNKKKLTRKKSNELNISVTIYSDIVKWIKGPVVILHGARKLGLF